MNEEWESMKMEARLEQEEENEYHRKKLDKRERKNTLYSFIKGLLEAMKHGVTSEAAIRTLKDEIEEIDAMEG